MTLYPGQAEMGCFVARSAQAQQPAQSLAAVTSEGGELPSLMDL
jgi:hypothetical protein